VGPFQRIKHCPLGLKSHAVTLCPLHQSLDEAIAMVETAFARSFIAELVPEQTVAEPFRDPPGISRRRKLKVLR
jgi:Rrf2 family transcriptional regulator, nitric oxide-sensitive transcriptional repressor